MTEHEVADALGLNPEERAVFLERAARMRRAGLAELDAEMAKEIGGPGGRVAKAVMMFGEDIVEERVLAALPDGERDAYQAGQHGGGLQGVEDSGPSHLLPGG